MCGYVPVLAEKYPEQGDAAERGTKIHAEIAAHLKHGDKCKSPEAMAASVWIDHEAIGEQRVEQATSLVDSESMEIVTEGTPDLVCGPDSNGTILVVDWKTGSPDNVPEPDDNLQLIAYGLAVCDGNPFRCALVFLGWDKVKALWSRTFEPNEHPALFARVKAAATKEPIPHPGEHCGSCYQRRYCHAWQAREGQALALIDQDRTLTVTNDNAGQIMARVKAVKEAAEVAEAMVKAHVKAGGQCVVDGKVLTIGMCKGRESADVAALKADGLTKYIKQGAPYERATWKKVTP